MATDVLSTSLNIRAYSFLLSTLNLRLNPPSDTVPPSTELALYNALAILTSEGRTSRAAVSGSSDKTGQLANLIFIFSPTEIDHDVTVKGSPAVSLAGNGHFPDQNASSDSADNQPSNIFDSTHMVMNCDKVFPAVVGLDQESDMPLSELRLLCARKALLGIRERLVVDRSIVEGGFIQVLNSERISVPREIPIDYPDELLPDLSPSYYAIPPTLHSFFKSSKVPRSSLNEPYFELTSASLPAWRDVITHLLGCLATSLGIPHDSQTPAGTDISCLSESNLRLILAMLDAIRSLVATRGFQAFLRTDNVNATLGLAIMTKDIEMNRRNEMKMRTYLPNFSSTRRHCSANPSRWNLLDLADLRQETIETYYNLFTRWLLGLTAWVDAFDIVTRHPLLRAQNKPIRVHRLCTKTSETRMTPIQAIVDSAMDGFSSVQIVKTSISKYLQCIVSADAWNDGMGFSGSLHSEAASIALNIGLRNGSVQLEEENIVDVRVRKTYCSVGLSHKSCWCCARLALLGREHGLKFEIKGTHQVVYPWDPPKFGISHADLQTIEAGLKKKLVNSLQFLATSPTPVSPK